MNKMARQLFSVFFLVFSTGIVMAMPGDTIWIDPSQINTKVLKEGTHRYLVYFKKGKDSSRTMTQFWTRKIVFVEYGGKEAIRIDQEWEDKDTIMHTATSVCDRKTMAPLFHETWWKQRGSGTYDFVNKSAVSNGYTLNDEDTAGNRKIAWTAFKKSWSEYVLNWHLDLETFPLLPYKEGRVFLVPYYEPGFTESKPVAYSVTGSAMLDGYDGQQIDCWILTHETKGNKEVFWISKKTKEVLKLEQCINDRIYRYKIKLGFSV